MEPSAVLQEMNTGRVNEALLTSGDRVIFSGLATSFKDCADAPRFGFPAIFSRISAMKSCYTK